MIDYIPPYIPEPVKDICKYRMSSKYDISTCNIRYVTKWDNKELYVYFLTVGTGKDKYKSEYKPILYNCEKVEFYNENDIEKINILIKKNINKNNKPKYCQSLKK